MYEKIQEQGGGKEYGKEKEQNQEKQKEQGHAIATQENNNNQWLQRKNKYKKDSYGHIVGEIGDKTDDIKMLTTFDALNHEQQENQKETSNMQQNESTKDWVNKSFDKCETGEQIESGTNQQQNKSNNTKTEEKREVNTKVQNNME